MMDIAEKVLQQKGIEQKNIHIECFSSNVPVNVDGTKK